MSTEVQFIIDFRLKDYEAASKFYQNGILVAKVDSKEAALLHGNLSATLMHQSKWASCIWHTCVALRLHSDLQSATAKRLQGRLKQACEKLGRKELTDFSECCKWIENFAEELAHPSEVEEQIGDVILPLPKYGRSVKVHHH